ncbi:Mitochondrial inner membrane protease subunit 1 [Diplodia seriata]|uniref:Mitochondrial inner membrane protease subunit 1 n=1 Tax=Diplodia seriata TaxID=420778 RepID=A0A1S8BKA1_9PEZI|nr:Mitochondrial inner membrane protease subunit 1 [Diplodia seriata]
MPLPRFLPRFLPRRLNGFGSHALTAVRLAFHSLSYACMAHVFFAHGYVVKLTYGPSMAPTMGAFGDAVVVSKRHRRGRDIFVGDLVSYESPFRSGYSVIKRVVGMPGDFVLRDTPGADGSRGIVVQVPDGHCWVAGDNQAHSRDSRLHGPVPLGLVAGKVVCRVLPFGEAGWFENTLKEPMEEELD